MIYKLHNKYDVYFKIVKIIDSCKTINQVLNCRHIINRFNDIYDDNYLYDDLYNKYRLQLIDI